MRVTDPALLICRFAALPPRPIHLRWRASPTVVESRDRVRQSSILFLGRPEAAAASVQSRSARSARAALRLILTAAGNGMTCPRLEWRQLRSRGWEFASLDLRVL